MNTYLEKYLNLLWDMLVYDIEVFKQPWMYYLLLVPAICYLAFFFLKWLVLTTPLWMPFWVIFNSAFRTSTKKTKC